MIWTQQLRPLYHYVFWVTLSWPIYIYGQPTKYDTENECLSKVDPSQITWPVILKAGFNIQSLLKGLQIKFIIYHNYLN